MLSKKAIKTLVECIKITSSQISQTMLMEGLTCEDRREVASFRASVMQALRQLDPSNKMVIDYFKERE